MKQIKYIVLTLAIVAGFGLIVAPSAGAVNVFDPCSGGASDSAICQSSGDTVAGFLSTGVNLLLYILGAIAVVMIIVGGIYYVVSGGDATATTKAKNTILYSVVGLIVALLAYAIVNFVISSFTSSVKTDNTSQSIS